MAWGAVYEPTVQHDLAQIKYAVTTSKSRVTAADASGKLLDTSSAKHKANMFRLTTTLAASKPRVAELECDTIKASNNMSMARNAAHEAITIVFDLEGQITNLTSQVNDCLHTAVAAAPQRVGHIQIPPTGRQNRTKVVPTAVGLEPEPASVAVAKTVNPPAVAM